MDWHLYILDCDGRLYTGIAKDPARRLEEHRAGKSRGARFTRAARSVNLVYTTPLGEHGLALRAEARVKKMPRSGKVDIVQLQPSREVLLRQLEIDEMAIKGEQGA